MKAHGDIPSGNLEDRLSTVDPQIAAVLTRALDGHELDFSDGLNGKGFVFNNPNAQKTCGCGSSFGV